MTTLLSLLIVFIRTLRNLCRIFQANDEFWKVKYDHEAAKQARAAKKTERKAAKTGTSKKKKPSASDLLRLEDSSSDEEEVIFKFS